MCNATIDDFPIKRKYLTESLPIATRLIIYQAMLDQKKHGNFQMQ